MNYKLILHNINAAWRDLMKYKVQNIISVFCLAVGMTCFCVTLFLLNSFKEFSDRVYMGGGDRCVVALHEKNDSSMDGNVYFTPERLKLLADSHLSSIRFIDPNESIYTGYTPIKDKKGREHVVWAQNYWVSPELLNYQGFRSAITGKRIPVLKPGDIVMTKGMLERTFGRGVDLRGYTTTAIESFIKSPGTGFNRIVDVVDTGDFFLSEDKLLVVTDLLQEMSDEYRKESKYHCPLNLMVCLAEGKTRSDLEKEMQEVFPQYEIRLFGDTDAARAGARVLFTILVVIGSCVLLVGLLGFLKMQTQLFRLRQREMGLRRCMGATGSQLLWLLVCEVGIVFLFVASLTLMLTFLLADYSIPVIRQFFPFFAMDVPRTFATELYICLAVFLLTAALASLSARKVVSSELGTVVGKSRKVSTRGRSLLIIMQMLVSQIFVFICCMVFYFLSSIAQSSLLYQVPAEAQAYRNCIALRADMVLPGILEKVKALDDVEDVSLVGFYYGALTMQVAGNFLPMLGLEVRATASKQEIEAQEVIPVYEGYLPQDSAHALGYISAKLFPEAYNYSQRITELYVCDADSMTDRRNWFRNDFIVIKAKPHRYGKVWKEVSALYHEAGYYQQVDAPIENFHDVAFRAARWMRLLRTIVLVLTFVTLLSIVLTTFSSVSLDTRVRQKEVAIRKACGASGCGIMWLFGRWYLLILTVSTVLSFLLYMLVLIIMMGMNGEDCLERYVAETFIAYAAGVIAVTLVTLLSVGYNIYRVSKLNPAAIIKKE